MPTYCWLYTGSTLEEAYQKAQTAQDIVNAECQRIIGQDWSTEIRPLTATPVINEVEYYYMFQAPPEIFRGEAEYDLEIEFSQDWFIPEI